MSKIIKRPVLNIGLKAQRGFVSTPKGYRLQKGIRQHAFFKEDPDLVILKPGVETEIVKALPALPDNANLKKLVAEMEVKKHQFEQKADVQEMGEEKKTFTVSVEGLPLPRNVTVRLAGGEVFLFNAGELAEKTYSIPDFAEHVNNYLDEFRGESEEGFLRFLVKSDTPGKVKITIKDIKSEDYSLIQPQEWSNPLDDTTRIDRNYQLDYSMIESEELNTISDPDHPNVTLNRIKMDIGGEFGQERLLGSVDEHDGKKFVTISNDYSFAQKFAFETSEFELAKPVKCVGISGFFQTGAEAELYIEIQNDMNGFPASGSPLTKANLSLVSPEKNGSGFWAFCNFDAPVDFNAATFYWIVIKGVQGEAQFGLKSQEDGYLKEVRVNRGGQFWRPIRNASDPTIAGLLRLVYLPEIDNQTAAVEIGIKGTRIFEKFNPGPEAEIMSLGTFSIGLKFHGDLDRADISDDLKQEFQERGIRLSQNTIISVKQGGSEWLLDDENNQQKYLIKKERDLLNIYVDIKQATIVIKSHARGTLSIANVIQEYSPV